MQHGDYRVKILDESGKVVGAKPRKEINKATDIVHCADVIVMHNGKIALARIPVDGLYPNKLATSSATMVREDEDAMTAALRGLQKELGVAGVDLKQLGEEFFTFDDGVKRLKTTYLCRYDGEFTPNFGDLLELVFLSSEELQNQMTAHPDHFAPTFTALWERYKVRLHA